MPTRVCRICGLCRRLALMILLLALGAGGCGWNRASRVDSETYWWPEQILTPAERRAEIDEKTARLTDLMKREALSGLVIRNAPAFAWITAGCESPVPLYIGSSGRKYLVGSSGEASRLLSEDLKGMGFELARGDWVDASKASEEAIWSNLAAGRQVGSDKHLEGFRLVDNELARLQSVLTDAEIKKYRWLGKAFAEALESACSRIPRGLNERAIETSVQASIMRRAIRPVSILVSSDSRIESFGIAPPDDDHKSDRAFVVRVCGRRWGMHVEATRMVSFGPPDAEISRRAAAAAEVEARLWDLTVPGIDPAVVYARMGELDKGISEDGPCGFGGVIGYFPAGQAIPDGVSATDAGARAFCWRSCVGGLGMSDTVMLFGGNFEVLTRTEAWPVFESRAGGRVYRTAGILVR
jgi:hypothetical protein